MKRNRLKAAASVAAFALLITACGGGEESPDDSAATAPDETTESGETEGAETGEEGDPAAEGDAPADAEPWPHPLTVYVPAPAGGGFDILVRTLQPYLEEELGNSVIVENLEGAGGAVAAQQMLGEPSDGSRILIISRTIMGVPYTGTPEVDPLTYLTPVGHVSEDVSAVTVRADAPYETIDDFIEAARENPGGLQVGNSGTGSVWHSAALMLEREAEIELAHVPYQGGSPAGAALAAGELDAITIGAPEVVGLVEAGEAKVLAVMAEERSDLFPDVPTLTEAGYDVVYAVWRSLVANADTPEETIQGLIDRIEAAASNEEFVQDMDELGFDAQYRTPEEQLGLMEEEDVLFRELYEGQDFFNTEPDRVSGGS